MRCLFILAALQKNWQKKEGLKIFVTAGKCRGVGEGLLSYFNGLEERGERRVKERDKDREKGGAGIWEGENRRLTHRKASIM